jgi:hypothetical protein
MNIPNASNFKTKKTKYKFFQLKLHKRNNQITISSLIFLRNENLKWRKVMDFLKIFFVIHWSTFIQNLYLRNKKEKWDLDLRLNVCGMQVSFFVCVQLVQVLRTTKLSLLLFRSFVKETQSVSVHFRAQNFFFQKSFTSKTKFNYL